MGRSPIRVGTGLAFASALLFGVATPWLQRAGRGVGPFATAALLYAGAAAFSMVARRRVARRNRTEAPLSRKHVGRLIGVALLGAVVAPAALAWGLARTSGTVGALLLNLEAAFTIALGALFYREHVGGRVAVAALCIGTGGALLVMGGGIDARLSLPLVAVVVATLGWAADNALSRPLAELDPASVVATKGGLGALLSTGVAIAAGEHMPDGEHALGLLACGAVGYGMSLRLYLLAQRRLGAGRTASVFATAPFVGALASIALGEAVGGVATAGAAVLMAVGVALHLGERHEHAHMHEATEHDHAHRHDDGHHDHTHDPMPVGAHSHTHKHDPVAHEHPHAPDVHHQHRHRHGA